MLRAIFSISLSFMSIACLGQFVLKTPDGRSVKLNPNGTWTFVKENPAQQKEPGKSIKDYTGKYSRFALSYDANDWKLQEDKDGEWQISLVSADDALNAYYSEYRLMLGTNDPNEYYSSYFAELGEVKSISKNDTVVNDLKITRIQVELLAQGLLYEYLAYIHSSEAGSYQFFVGTQKHIFAEDKIKILKLLNSVRKF